MGDGDDGGRGRLAQLFEREANQALRVAYLLTSDQAVAEDLVQEAFVRLVGRYAHLRNPDAFAAYLRRTVVNLGRSHLRRRRTERKHLGHLVVVGEAAVSADVDARADMWRALQRLPFRQRAALVLRFYEDLPEPRIAEILGCRVGTVKSLISRGLAALRSNPAFESPEAHGA